jgi:hypothetical protein
MTLLTDPSETRADELRMTPEARHTLDEAVEIFRRNLTTTSKRIKKHELIVEEDVLRAVDGLTPSRRAGWAQGLTLAVGGFGLNSLAQVIRAIVVAQPVNWFDIIILIATLTATGALVIAAIRADRRGGRAR